MSESVELEIVGIQFNETPRLARTWLSLNPGMTVLYGLNGAGKTTIVEEVRRFLSPATVDWSPHRIYLRHRGLASACSKIDPTASGEWWEAAVTQIRLIPGLYETVRPQPHGRVALTPALHECLCSGYLCLSRSAPAIPSYTLSAVAPLDGSMAFVQTALQIKHNQLSEELEEFQTAIKRADAGDQHIVLSGLTIKVTPAIVEAIRLNIASLQSEPQTEELTVGLLTPWFMPVDSDLDPTDEELIEQLEAPAIPSDRRDEGADGNGAGAQYLRLIDIAEIWQSPLTLSGDPDCDPVADTAAHCVRKFLDKSGEQRAFSLFAQERSGIPPGAVELDDTKMVVELDDAWLNELASKAQNQYTGLLLDAPTLTIGRTTGLKGLTGAPFEWRVKLADQKATIGIGELSSAQGVWARFAISRASRAGVPTPVELVLLDEPERGLHRAAESYLASGLARVAASPGVYMVAATHSPDLLDQPDTQIVAVTREVALTHLRPMNAPDRESLRSFGLHPSDLLKRVKTFVLVEGPHDRSVFEAAIGQELRQARAQILYLGGATQLKAALDGQFLCDYSDARIVAVLDNLEPAIIKDAWRDAKSVMISDGFPAARELLYQRLPAEKSKSKSDEATEVNVIREFMIRALETGKESRIIPFGMSKKDIIMYLPVEALVPCDESWDALWTAFELQKGNKNALKNFKGWLRDKRGTTISTEDVQSAARNLDEIHPDIAALLTTVT